MTTIESSPPAPPSRLRRALRACGYTALALTAWTVAASVYLYRTADADLENSLDARNVVDVTGLSRTQVGRVVEPKRIEEIAQVLRETKGPVSIGGARCSMGGQVAEPGSIHFDMRGFNQVLAFSPAERTIRVQAGATWHHIQEHIDASDLAIQIMQTYSNFTVGGSLSVNAHGRYMGRGPIAQSVKALRLVLASGEIVDASPTENAELFYGALGGYGGLGVIAEATLALAPNGKVKRTTVPMPTSEYAAYFKREIRDNPKVVFHNADLHPPDFTSARAVSWSETDDALTETEHLIPMGQSYHFMPWVVNDLPRWPGGYALRKYVLEPLGYAKNVVTYRNHEASYDIHEIEPASREKSTFVLREYFVPAEKFDEFVPKMAAIFKQHHAQVANISVRHASPDPGTLLAWARGETFAFVVYYEQGTSPEAIAEVGRWSREMVDAVLAVGGTYYLPYQNHPTREQFARAYPRATEYFALKQRVDPELRFQNSLFYHYGPSPRRERDEALDKLGYERKPEGQTILMVPEWYLVWNPLEYADHLARGRAPDAFPFFESVREYARLYKKVVRLTEKVYPPNDEYMTMLNVIGVSTAVEYVLKGSYEATIGRLARATASDLASREEAIMLEAQQAYGKLIFDEPWYVFRFVPWVKRMWSETPLFGENFIRRTERKLFFTTEYLVKGAYATFLGIGARLTYGPAKTTLHALVARPPTLAGQTLEGTTPVGTVANGLELVSLERWKEFSEVVPKLASRGLDFVEIAGNDDIVVSLVENAATPYETTMATRLFRSRVVSDASASRSVWFVPVRNLGAFLRDAATHGTTFEHVYDY